MGAQLTVQVVEDDRHIRNRLVRAIVSHAELVLVSQAGTFREAKEALLADQPDVFLVDLGLPDGDGVDLIRLVSHQSKGTTRSIVFSVFGDEKRVVRAIEAGASGYLLKDTGISALPAAIIELAEGKSPMSPAIASHLLKRFRPVHTAPPATREQRDSTVCLSVREIEVLEYVSKGFSAREISEMMKITYHTVVSHTKKIYRKLNVSSRTEAVFEAEQAGIIQIMADR